MDLKVNYGSLSTASGDLGAGAAAIANSLESMDAELQQLRSNWEGDAQEAYLVAKQQWTDGMTGMRDVLAQISRMVDSANQSYNSTDTANAARFQ